VFAVLAVFLVGVVPWILLVALAQRPQVPEDTVTVYGIVASLGLVSLVLTLLVSLGFLLGTLLRNTLVTLVVLIFFWFPFGVILNVFSLEEFSPISLNRALPTLLRQPWREAEEGPDAVALDRGKEIEAMADQAAKFFSVFSGAPKERPKAEPKFFNADEYDDFSLFRVTLGYGIPTLLSVILAMAVFSWRDL
jgi:ABC-type transport system involved in multi-copper enzyme maturation permease subunit